MGEGLKRAFAATRATRAKRTDREAEALRALLLKYVRHVERCEGTNFIDGYEYVSPDISEKEWALFRQIDSEVKQAGRGNTEHGEA